MTVTGGMNDLVEFLRARNGEARERGMFLRTLAAALPTDPTALRETADWIEAEVEAKRDLILLYQQAMDAIGKGTVAVMAAAVVRRDTLYRAMVTFAAAWSDHPDYREEWRPL